MNWKERDKCENQQDESDLRFVSLNLNIGFSGILEESLISKAY